MAGRHRRFVDAPDRERCCWTITRRDGSRARCGRRAARDAGCCVQHYGRYCQGLGTLKDDVEMAANQLRQLAERVAVIDGKSTGRGVVRAVLQDLDGALFRARLRLRELGA